jgi:hypothetical protein
VSIATVASALRSLAVALEEQGDALELEGAHETTPAEDLDRFITIAESALRLSIGRSTAFRMAADGTFPVPVHNVAGKQVVSLRLLIEFIHAGR